MRKNTTMLNYCGYPATDEYIRADLKARGLDEEQIKYYLCLMEFCSSAIEALQTKREIDWAEKEG